MKKLHKKMIFSAVLVGSFFIGIIKGQESRSQWISKMKDKYDVDKLKTVKDPGEVTLDDFEIASFHKN